jgi:hypothetical protein
MKNLHLKNLNNTSLGFLILKKLYELKQNNKNIVPYTLTKTIHKYIYSLKFKNENIKKYMLNFVSILNQPTISIIDSLDTTIKIITLLYKYKLNELDINNKIDINKIKNDEINLTSSKIGHINVIGLHYSYFQYEAHRSETLKITCSDNIIKEIWSRSL